MKPPTTTCFLCVHASIIEVMYVCMCACFCAAVGGGDLVHDPSVLQPSLCPPIFIFQEALRLSVCPPATHCYPSSRRKQLQLVLDVFLCLIQLLSLSMKAKKEKTDINCVCLCVCCVDPDNVWLDSYG